MGIITLDVCQGEFPLGKHPTSSSARSTPYSTHLQRTCRGSTPRDPELLQPCQCLCAHVFSNTQAAACVFEKTRKQSVSLRKRLPFYNLRGLEHTLVAPPQTATTEGQQARVSADSRQPVEQGRGSSRLVFIRREGCGLALRGKEGRRSG